MEISAMGLKGVKADEQQRQTAVSSIFSSFEEFPNLYDFLSLWKSKDNIWKNVSVSTDFQPIEKHFSKYLVSIPQNFFFIINKS